LHGWPADAPNPAIAPFDAAQAKRYQDEWAAYLKVPVEYTNSIGMKFRLIPPGEFEMGSTPQAIEAARAADKYSDDQALSDALASEGPLHKVVLTEAFYLSVATPGEYRYKGADLGILVARGRMGTADNQPSERCRRWVDAIKAQFAGTPVAPDEPAGRATPFAFK